MKIISNVLLIWAMSSAHWMMTSWHWRRLAANTPESCMVFAEIHTIGDWVRFLELMHGVYESDEMINRVEFL